MSSSTFVTSVSCDFMVPWLHILHLIAWMIKQLSMTNAPITTRFCLIEGYTLTRSSLYLLVQIVITVGWLECEIHFSFLPLIGGVHFDIVVCINKVYWYYYYIFICLFVWKEGVGGMVNLAVSRDRLWTGTYYKMFRILKERSFWISNDKYESRKLLFSQSQLLLI